jgi:hypothetical protein
MANDLWRSHTLIHVTASYVQVRTANTAIRNIQANLPLARRERFARTDAKSTGTLVVHRFQIHKLLLFG